MDHIAWGNNWRQVEHWIGGLPLRLSMSGPRDTCGTSLFAPAIPSSQDPMRVEVRGGPGATTGQERVPNAAYAVLQRCPDG